MTRNLGLRPAVLLHVALVAAAVITVFSRLRAGAASLSFYDDDFFYYLKIAENLASGMGSTFDGIHATNGYHPVWLLILTVLSKLLTQQHVLFAVLCLMCLSTAVTYVFVYRCLSVFTKNAVVASLIAAFIGLGALQLMKGGMEIILAIPATCALCYFRLRSSFRWGIGTAFVYGLLGSVVILSRLDAMLLIAVLFALELGRPQSTKQRFQNAAGMLIGLLPVAAYLVSNHGLFGTLMPCSGQAKQLRVQRGFSAIPLLSVLLSFSTYARLTIVVPSILGTILAASRVSRDGWGRVSVEHRPLVVALIAFPVLHLGTISWMSDWPLWPWYLYSFVIGQLGVAVALLAQDHWKVGHHRLFERSAAVFLVLFMCIQSAARYASGKLPARSNRGIYTSAVEIASFAQTHPGIYAMGDRAGVTGYLLRNPLIQLEGLVMDPHFTSAIKQDLDLTQVFTEYHVDYFITVSAVQQSNCYSFREPWRAGPRSHAMRGVLCDAPVKQLMIDGIPTLIFDVRSNRTPSVPERHLM